MVSTILFAFSLVFAQAVQPTPAASLPPEIIHTVSSESCTALSNLLLPVGQASKLNDKGFDAMSAAVGGYMSHMMFGDDPNIRHPSLQVAPNGSGGAGAGGATGISPTEADPIAFGPDQTIKMSRINTIAGELTENVTYERRLLAQSYAAEPRGKNPTVDALRQKTENLIETQNVLLQRFQNLASMYLENIGEAGMECSSGSCSKSFSANLRALIFGSTIGLNTNTAAAASSATGGYKDTKQLAKVGSAADVIGAIRFNEVAFTSSLYDVYNECHGTHYVVPKATTPPGLTP